MAGPTLGMLAIGPKVARTTLLYPDRLERWCATQANPESIDS
jgi:hypothetical protein